MDSPALLIVSDSDTWPLHPAGKCCGVYRFHPARPTHLIIIAAISGGCPAGSTVATLSLLGRCSASSSKLTLSLFGRLLHWLQLMKAVAGAWLCLYLLSCWGLYLLGIRPPCWLWPVLTHSQNFQRGNVAGFTLLSSSPPDTSYYHSCHFGRLLCQLHGGHNAVTRAVLHQLQRANIVIVAVRAVALLEIRPPCWLCQTLTHGHCFQLMKCCGVHCFHSARPTHLIIIAAISGGGSIGSTCWKLLQVPDSLLVPAGDLPALLIVSDSDTWPLLTQAQNITIFLLFCVQYPQIRKSTRKKWNFRYA